MVKQNKPIFVSIIIPVKEINDFIRKETVPAILKQNYKDYEIIILPDQPTKEKLPKSIIVPTFPKTGPADKRDIGVGKSKGQIIAFLDDDSYPENDWMSNAVKIFEENTNYAGVCGPALTPPHNNLRQKASGYVWSTWVGSGGAGICRSLAVSRREVDDYPTVNLLVKKKDFLEVGGFDSHFWPGEDTKLCHDLVYRLKKKILYDPRIVVYHHRREIFKSHLQQISRYAIHRGHFAKILPKTSFKIGYLIPSFFALGLIFGIVFIQFHPVLFSLYFLIISLYVFLLILTAIQVYIKEKNLWLSFLMIPTIFITHFVYGILFIKGYFTPKLKV